MVGHIIAIAKTFTNLIYPLHCAVCKKPLDPMDRKGVCAYCAGQVRRNPKPYRGPSGYCKNASFNFTVARSACLYEGVMRELVHAFKYGNSLRLGGFLSNLMIDFLKDNPELSDRLDAVTFVPLDNNRLRERGFNQSKVLASKISEMLKIPVVDSLDKVMKTRHQSELPRDKRLSNLKGAFRARKPEEIHGKRMLLVDDVMTTGSTLNECSRVLAECGALEVRCLALSRGI